jgi:hypothetical protein
MQAGGEERGQPLARLGSEPCLAKADRVETKRQRAVADQVTRRSLRFAQDGTGGRWAERSWCRFREDLSTRHAHAAKVLGMNKVLGMKTPNLEELRIGGALQDNQAGVPFNAFNRGARIRHAQLGTWWERVLAVLSLIFVVATLIGLLVRSF